MKFSYKYFIIFLSLLFYSCSTQEFILSDCFAPSKGIGINLISYSYNSSNKLASISGIVTDNLTGEPMIGADIKLLPCRKDTVSNFNGIFNFEYRPSECDSINFRMFNYHKTYSLIRLIADFVTNKKM